MSYGFDTRDGLLIAAISVVVGALAVSGESLWIDELASLAVANHRGFEDVVSAALRSPESDGQMPLYMAWLWGWIRLFGDGERALRSANIPWLAAGTVALAFWAARSRVAPAALAAAVTLVSPLLWTYMNEARPYVMQFAGSAMFLGALAGFTVQAAEDRPVVRSSDIALALLGAVLLGGSSLLGTLWLITGLPLVALMALRSRWSVDRRGLLALVCGGAALLGLGLYYGATLRGGARAATIDSSVWTSLGSIGYELMGLLGVGPARLEIRAEGPGALVGWLWVLGPATAVLVTMAALGVRRALSDQASARSVLWVQLLVGLPPVIFLLALGQVVDFRVLARHVMPLMPPLLLVVAMAASALLRSGRVGRVLCALFVGIWLVSSFSLRFADRHAKDDYRGAARMARAVLDEGGRVWWLAMPRGAEHYGLGRPGGAGAGTELTAPQNVTELPDGPVPDLVLLSKTDLFDRHGTVEVFAAREMRLICGLPAFAVYAGPRLTSPPPCVRGGDGAASVSD